MGSFEEVVICPYYVALGYRSRASVARPHPQRHITSEATEEVKFDGYRAIGVKRSRDTVLYSRNGKNFNRRFPQIAEAVADLPAETVIDGEVVAIDDMGRPDFHALQHFQAAASRIRYFVFDVLILNGRDLTNLSLTERRKVLTTVNVGSSWIRVSAQFDIAAENMLSAVRKQGLEGVVAKRKDSLYEPGKRSGSWVKLRINRGQEFRHRRIQVYTVSIRSLLATTGLAGTAFCATTR